jgi:hypothetical protein
MSVMNYWCDFRRLSLDRQHDRTCGSTCTCRYCVQYALHLHFFEFHLHSHSQHTTQQSAIPVSKKEEAKQIIKTNHQSKSINQSINQLFAMAVLTAEEITSQIADLGEKIKQAKIEKKTQEFWGEFLQSMLALKVRLRYVTLRYVTLRYVTLYIVTLHRCVCYAALCVSSRIVSSRIEQTND